MSLILLWQILTFFCYLLFLVSVILAWSRSSHPEAAIRAHAFMENLKGLHDGGMMLEVDADRISYNTVIAAYQKSKRDGSAEEAERVYNSLENLYGSTNDRNYQPDTITFCSLLGAYANKGNAHKAEELLLRFYKEHKADNSRTAPDASCFDQVLLAWARKGSEGATKRAEMLLKLMTDMSSSPTSSLSPTTSTYNIVLHALANSGDFSAPFRAQMLLESMKSGELGNRGAVRPNTVTYTTVISVMCRLGGKDVVNTLKKLFDEATESPGVNVDDAFFANMLSSMAYCFQEGILEFAEELVEKRMPEGVWVEVTERTKE